MTRRSILRRAYFGSQDLLELVVYGVVLFWVAAGALGTLYALLRLSGLL